MSDEKQHTPQNLFFIGGAGLIGTNFVHYWLRRYTDNRVVVLNAETYAGNVENLKSVEEKPNFCFENLNILDCENAVNLLREEKPIL